MKIIGKKGEVEKEMLVDMGSTHTWVRAADLDAIGVEAIQTIDFTTIEGKKIRRSIGRAEVEVMRGREVTIVVFAEPSDKEVFGFMP